MSHWTSVERLDKTHDLEDFTCGDDGMDSWLRSSARGAQSEFSCGVYVCLGDDRSVLGYFSLALNKLAPAELPSEKIKRNSVPVITLAKIAIHEEKQRKGIGTLVLVEALAKAVSAAEIVGGAFVIVDVPNPDNYRFYSRNSFKPVSEDKQDRVYMKMASARRILEDLF